MKEKLEKISNVYKIIIIKLNNCLYYTFTIIIKPLQYNLSPIWTENHAYFYHKSETRSYISKKKRLNSKLWVHDCHDEN